MINVIDYKMRNIFIEIAAIVWKFVINHSTDNKDFDIIIYS